MIVGKNALNTNLRAYSCTSTAFNIKLIKISFTYRILWINKKLTATKYTEVPVPV